ncbi:hypothetical protein [Nocardia sp. NPDC019395]|uniref:hypothetical protein n=1 Tax=Nocardia sp. NPDC019395 TaxID=3154686 RepID=UPI0033E05BDD
MGYRSAFGFGILAAGFVVAAGVSAPVATAADLPPGISCDAYKCTNDTADQHLVRGTVFCDETDTIEPVQFLLSAHDDGRPLFPCNTVAGYSPDGTPHTGHSNNYSMLHVDSAVVHNGPWVNTGSAG